MKMMLQKPFVATGGRGIHDRHWNWKRRIVDVTFIFDRVAVAADVAVVPGASQLN